MTSVLLENVQILIQVFKISSEAIRRIPAARCEVGLHVAVSALRLASQRGVRVTSYKHVMTKPKHCKQGVFRERKLR